MSMVLDVTDASFQKDVLQSRIPVVVDFWADWCNPCRLLSPIVRDLAEEMKGKVLFVKVDVDTNPHIANSFGIQSIPTIIVFSQGQPVAQRAGLLSKDALRASIQQVVGV